jgi:hypothetical protein
LQYQVQPPLQPHVVVVVDVLVLVFDVVVLELVVELLVELVELVDVLLVEVVTLWHRHGTDSWLPTDPALQGELGKSQQPQSPQPPTQLDRTWYQP